MCRKKILTILSVVIFVTQVCCYGGPIIYVDDDANGINDGTSWDNAYTYLQDALADANSAEKPVEIRVAQGIYRPDRSSAEPNGTGDRAATFQLINGVALKGGYAGPRMSLSGADPNARDIDFYETVLSGDLNGDDIEVSDPCDLLTEPTRAENSYHVVTGSGTDETAVLDGFTISAGIASEFSPSPHGLGGGMYNDQGSPTVTNCTFVGNLAEFGGAMRNIYNSNPTLTNCTFLGNWAGSGGGMWNNSSSSPRLNNCVFSGNMAGNRGGGIFNHDNSSPTLVNCTFSANAAGRYGGGLASQYGNPTLTNCILWGNLDKDGMDESAQIYKGIPVINYSCIQNWTGRLDGTSNTGENPFFVNANGGDNVAGTEDDNLRLRADSPCIDAGDNSGVPPSLLTDLDGNPRITNGTVDMGAYEGPHQCLWPNTRSVTVPEGGTSTFTVRLGTDPFRTVEVTVSVQSGDPDIIVESGETLTFDSFNYWEPQIVTLAGLEDEDYIDDTALILVSAPGFLTVEVIATERDSDNVLFVDARVVGAQNGTSWKDAFTNLQDALSLAAEFPGVIEEVRVAQGIYKPAGPGGDRTAAFELINGVAIRGGYAGFGEADPNARDINKYKTILSGDLNRDDGLNFVNNSENSYHVVVSDEAGGTDMLDGFTITGGNANGPRENHQNDGGGMYNDSGSLTIRNCTFSRNSAKRVGGGMSNRYGRPTLLNCTVIWNWGFTGGGMHNAHSSPTLAHCIFNGNWADYGGGGGMYNYWGSNPTLTNCIFSRNCTSDDGGGMFNSRDSYPTLTNCTFNGNSAEYYGSSGMYNYFNAIPTLTNCILWGDTSGEIYTETPMPPVITYSNVEGGWDGQGNIDTDPCFADAPNGDYHLKSEGWRWDTKRKVWTWDEVTSPCIDAGNPGCALGDELLSVPADPNNQWGENLRINMGAYGGTDQASMALPGWALLADLTNDRRVDFNDLTVFVEYWLDRGNCIPGDLSRNESIDFADFALMGFEWLKER